MRRATAGSCKSGYTNTRRGFAREQWRYALSPLMIIIRHNCVPVIQFISMEKSMSPSLDTASIIDRYQRGVGLVAIGRADRISPNRVRALLADAGVAIRPQGTNGTNGPRATPLDVAALVERYNTGETISSIASSVGRTFQTIRAALETADIPLRGRGIQKDGVKPRSRICNVCEIRISAMLWNDHQHEFHGAPETPSAKTRRTVQAYIDTLEAKPVAERTHCAGCKQRPCITPLCCGRRLRALTQHANRH